MISKNKRAFYDYLITERIEAGVSLVGTEVKSLRLGKVQISDAFVTIDERLEAWVHNLRIPQYEFGNINNHTEARKRKLLLQKKELTKLKMAMQAKGLSLIPIAIYFKSSLIKIEVGLGRGKKVFDKRQDEAKKDADKRIKKALMS
jgi:SsrA-binding protein